MDSKVLDYELEAKFFMDILTLRDSFGSGIMAHSYLPKSEIAGYQKWILNFRDRPFRSSDMEQLRKYAKMGIDPLGKGTPDPQYPYSLITEYLMNY